jgi:hypothetical protein
MIEYTVSIPAWAVLTAAGVIVGLAILWITR